MSSTSLTTPGKPTSAASTITAASSTTQPTTTTGTTEIKSLSSTSLTTPGTTTSASSTTPLITTAVTSESTTFSPTTPTTLDKTTSPAATSTTSPTTTGVTKESTTFTSTTPITSETTHLSAHTTTAMTKERTTFPSTTPSTSEKTTSLAATSTTLPKTTGVTTETTTFSSITLTTPETTTSPAATSISYPRTTGVTIASTTFSSTTPTSLAAISTTSPTTPGLTTESSTFTSTTPTTSEKTTTNASPTHTTSTTAVTTESMTFSSTTPSTHETTPFAITTTAASNTTPPTTAAVKTESITISSKTTSAPVSHTTITTSPSTTSLVTIESTICPSTLATALVTITAGATGTTKASGTAIIIVQQSSIATTSAVLTRSASALSETPSTTSTVPSTIAAKSTAPYFSSPVTPSTPPTGSKNTITSGPTTSITLRTTPTTLSVPTIPVEMIATTIVTPKAFATTAAQETTSNQAKITFTTTILAKASVIPQTTQAILTDKTTASTVISPSPTSNLSLATPSSTTKANEFPSTSTKVPGSNTPLQTQTETPTNSAKPLNTMTNAGVSSFQTSSTLQPEASTILKTNSPSTNVTSAAVVRTKLIFISSSSVPSESLVISAVNTLNISRQSQLDESVKLVNVLYEKISGTTYAVTFTFTMSNISMPENPEVRNDTFKQVQDVINKALNTLLNEPTSAVLQPKTSDFTSTSDQINGMINYIFQDGDVIQPVSFLNLLRLPIGLTTTVSPLTTSMFPVTSLNQVSGSAVVTTRLVFNSSPVPSEDLVLSAITTLKNSRESQLNDKVKVVNFTYEKISDTSYVLVITFSLSNISIPVIPELRNNTFSHVQNIANNALNTLLNEPTSAVLQPKTSDFTSTLDQIRGNINYTFQDADAIRPVSFLNLLQLPMGLTTVNTLTASTTLPPIVLGTAIIYIELVFITRGPAPNENSVLQIANSLLEANLRTRRDVQKLKDPVSFMNITYKKLNETAYSLTFGFEIGNVSMSEKFEFRNDTHKIVQDKINELLSKILNDPSAAQFKFPANFKVGNSNVIEAEVKYVFREGDIGAPSKFLEELLKINGVITTPAPATTFYPTVVNSTSAAWVVAIIVPCAIIILLVPCWILLCCLLCGCCARIRRRWHRRQSYNVQYTTRHSLF